MLVGVFWPGCFGANLSLFVVRVCRCGVGVVSPGVVGVAVVVFAAQLLVLPGCTTYCPLDIAIQYAFDMHVWNT